MWHGQRHGHRNGFQNFNSSLLAGERLRVKSSHSSALDEATLSPSSPPRRFAFHNSMGTDLNYPQEISWQVGKGSSRELAARASSYIIPRKARTSRTPLSSTYKEKMHSTIPPRYCIFLSHCSAAPPSSSPPPPSIVACATR